jgi:hypothetical protein
MITLQALALLRPAAAAGRAAPSLLRAFAAAVDGPKTGTPPPDTSRGATADLADVFIPGEPAAGHQQQRRQCLRTPSYSMLATEQTHEKYMAA